MSKSDEYFRQAKAGAELFLNARLKTPTGSEWQAYHYFVLGLEIPIVEACHGVYEASGPDAVCCYVEACYRNIDWGWCAGCEDRVPITQDTPDHSTVCLVCGSTPEVCKGCDTDNHFNDKGTCENCGRNIDSPCTTRITKAEVTDSDGTLALKIGNFDVLYLTRNAPDSPDFPVLSKEDHQNIIDKIIEALGVNAWA